MSDYLKNHPDIVDLARRYQPVAIDQEDLDNISAQSMIAQMHDSEPGGSLEDLACNSLTVILGEARSGKTTEFLFAVDKLSNKGQPAFFLRIEDLCHSAGEGIKVIRDALESDTEDFFNTWIDSAEEGIFFLDAVDEAKLRDVGDYRRAIRRFQKAMQHYLYRIRLVISCRITEWRPRDDIAPLERMIPALAKMEDESTGTKNKQQIKLVQLCPLDVTRVESLAQYRELPDISQFLDAIQVSDALEFAGRPGDAVELIELWRRQRRLGTLTDLVEQNIGRKLTEAGEVYKGVISAEQARVGAERLAAASVLCGDSSFRFAPPEQDPDGLLPALDPTTLLPEWNDEETNALLRRPIFDVATYGRVRFHTRSVREYLAASWLNNRHKNGCPSSDIIDIFFAKRYGRIVIRPGLTSVAAWLAPYVSELLEYVLQHNPEILPDEGDPQVLSPEIRGRVLTHFVQRYNDRTRTGFRFDRQGLKRFTHPDLSETINFLLEYPNTQDDVKGLLLDLVQVGKIVGCIANAAEIALDEAESSNTRVDAILALQACGAKEELRKLYLILKTSKKVSERFYGWALNVLYPAVISVQELVDLLDSIPWQVATVSDHVKDHLERIIKKETNASRLSVLAPALWRIVRDSLAEEGKKTSPNYWLHGTLCMVVAKWLEGASDAPNWLVEALDFIDDLPHGDYRTDKAIERIPELLVKVPTRIRETLFWRSYAAYILKYDSDEVYYFQLGRHRGFLNLVRDDVAWLLGYVQSEIDPRRRYVAFNTALSLCRLGPNKFEQIETLRAVAKPFPELTAYLEKCLTPLPPAPSRLATDLRRRLHELSDKRNLLETQEAVLPNLSKIASGESSDLLCRMYHFMKLPQDSHTGQEIWSLSPIFGRAGAEAFCSGIMKFWPTWEPDEERKHGDNMALIGIACAFEEGLDLSLLDEELAKKLTRLAFKEINLPDWFGQLLQHHRKTVLQVVRPLLEKDLTENKEPQAHPWILANIIHAGPSVLREFLPFIFETVKDTMPLLPNICGYIVQAFADEPNRHFLSSLIGDYFASQETLEGNNIYWLAIWLQVDAINALDWLEARTKITTSEEADETVLALAASLDQRNNGREVLDGKPDYISVAALRRLIPLIYHHVRPDEDPPRYGVYRPDSRDNAQSFRGSLIRHLADIPGEEAYRVLFEIRDRIPDQLTQDWILRKADEKVAVESVSLWTPRDVLEFERNHEHDPATADDLYVIVQKRLVEIKDKLERGDYSLRGLFTPGTDESLLQNYLAERLDELSRGRYSVAREVEVGRKKKPDIRIFFRDLPPVSIEVKWAHKWRLLQLEKALLEQLVGQYLKAVDSTHGLFVIVNVDPGETWSKRGMKGWLDFEGLINHLRLQAREIETSTFGVSRLDVLGIDCT